MKESLKKDLQSLKVEGNKVYLPTDELQNYAILKKTLVKACGKYKRNSFEFPYPARPIIDSLLSGEVVDFKKEFQFFATPSDLAEEMMNNIIGWPEKVLEPSAGHGNLIDAYRKIRPNSQITAIELSSLNYNILKDKYDNIDEVDLIHSDFMEWETDEKFDLIIANPPFSKDQDIEHVMKMYDLLDKGGRIVTIMSPGFTFKKRGKAKIFKEFLETQEGIWNENESKSFQSSGTNVQTITVVIDK